MSRVSDKPYFVYVLWSPSGGRFYIGISEDVEFRLSQHNSGEYKGWTNRYPPWTLVYSTSFRNYGDARRHELELKRQKGGTGFFQLTGLRPDDFRRGS